MLNPPSAAADSLHKPSSSAASHILGSESSVRLLQRSLAAKPPKSYGSMRLTKKRPSPNGTLNPKPLNLNPRPSLGLRKPIAELRKSQKGPQSKKRFKNKRSQTLQLFRRCGSASPPPRQGHPCPVRASQAAFATDNRRLLSAFSRVYCCLSGLHRIRGFRMGCGGERFLELLLQSFLLLVIVIYCCCYCCRCRYGSRSRCYSCCWHCCRRCHRRYCWCCWCWCCKFHAILCSQRLLGWVLVPYSTLSLTLQSD